MFKAWIREHKILAAILLSGFALRVSSILWGVPYLPYISGYHPDEPKVYNVIARFPGVYLTTGIFQGYGTTVQFIIGLFFLPAKLILVKWLGLQKAYSIFVIVLSRFVSVLAGTATIYLIYRLSRKLFDAKVGILGAAFFASAFYPTLNSSIITLDVTMGFLLVANFIICIYAIENNRLFPYVMLGAATATLIGTKITAALFIVVPFILSFLKTVYSESSQKNNSPAKNAGFLMAYIVITGIIFFIFNPHIIINPVKYIHFFIHNKAVWVDTVKVPFTDMLLIWARNIAICVGFPIALLSLGGILVPGKKNFRYKAMMIFFIIGNLIVWRWRLAARYVIFFAPLICIFAAHLCILIIGGKQRVFKIFGAACIFISLGYSIYLCLNGIYLRFADTRPPASKYIAERIPADSTIGLSAVSEKYTWRTHRWRYPRVDSQKHRIINFLERPEFLIMSSYDFNPIIKTLQSGKLSADYELDHSYNKEWYRLSAPSPEIFKFYDDLFIKKNSEYVLIKKFDIKVNVPVEFPPPEIRIYKRQKKVDQS